MIKLKDGHQNGNYFETFKIGAINDFSGAIFETVESQLGRILRFLFLIL